MPPRLLLAAHLQRYAAHGTVNHATGSGAWIAVLAGLIPILGIAAAGILVLVFLRRDGEAGDD
jgi:hypothetical protein